MIWRYLIIVVFVFSSCAEVKVDNSTSLQDAESSQDADQPYEIDDIDDIEYMDTEDVIEESSLKWDSDSFNVKLDSTLVSSWTFSHLYQVVMSEWPEAYEEFVDISFGKVEDRVTPETISFLVPTVKLAEIDSLEIENRFNRVSLKIKGFWSGCENYQIGEPQTYSWQKWDDKNVTKITFHFMFSC